MKKNFLFLVLLAFAVMSCSERENEAGVDNTQTQKEAELQSFLNDFRSFAKFAVNNPNATEAELTERLKPTAAKLDLYGKKYELSFPISEKGEAILLRSQQQNAEGANPVGDYIEFTQANCSERYQQLTLQMIDTGAPLAMSDAQIMADPRMIEAEKISLLCSNIILTEMFTLLSDEEKKKKLLALCFKEYDSAVTGCNAVLVGGISLTVLTSIGTAGFGSVAAIAATTLSYQLCVDSAKSTYETCVERTNIMYN
ncbi:hypothetical protein M2132_000876 [Dysgonomonas sp. PH5-45]|uniref:hypothetical protein n=1 Tax=unclassified Dysgonomonas TaxID=2630389 RepID=UPI002472F608|nr:MULTISPECIES: hypothetical protein [unclassified Dysgonomonas]MDH6354548.1 hypothetical protein [Dysgonomonas sp. PH5-45]MDH6387396.1 hypothetical protein [Dysgonomonas sp. PH5-37]